MHGGALLTQSTWRRSLVTLDIGALPRLVPERHVDAAMFVNRTGTRTAHSDHARILSGIRCSDPIVLVHRLRRRPE